MTDIVVETSDGVGRITLNRPQRINALTFEMIQRLTEVFRAVRDDDDIESVTLTGAGPKGFCAGADVRDLREHAVAGDPEFIRTFLDCEYELDELIATFLKPVTSHLIGICMGGGLGIGLHTPERIGDVSTRFAMPETAIGLWPDVGCCFELSRAPGEVGTYLAMTGETIDGHSAAWAGFLTTAHGTDPSSSWLASNAKWIDECFAADDAAEILARLEAHSDPEAKAAAEAIRKRSPLSVCVALEAVRRARSMTTVGEVLAQDARLGHAVSLDPDEFVEGVRAKMVDKDNDPAWRHANVADVSRDEVEARFGA